MKRNYREKLGYIVGPVVMIGIIVCYVITKIIDVLWSTDKQLYVIVCFSIVILPYVIYMLFLRYFVNRDYLSPNFFDNKIPLEEKDKKNLGDVERDEDGCVPVETLFGNGCVISDKIDKDVVKKLLLKKATVKDERRLLILLYSFFIIIFLILILVSNNDKSRSMANLMQNNENKQKEIRKLKKEALALTNKVYDKESKLKHINDINSQGFGYCPTNFVSCNDLEAIKKYLKAGMDINVKDSDGNTALIFSSKEGWEDIVSFLLEKGANINEANSEGETALIKAVQNGNLKIVKTLLEKHKAKVNIKDKKGKTALTYAITNNTEDKALRIVKKILKRDREVAEIPDEQGNSPLVYAINKGYKKIIEIFPCKSFEDENVRRALVEKGDTVIDEIDANCD